MLEPGRVCIKTTGREKGKYCIVVDVSKDGFVTVTGPKSVTWVRRRRCSIFHLQPLEERFEIGLGSDDSAIEKLWHSSGLIERFGIELPKRREKKREEKTEKKTVRKRSRKSTQS